MATGSKIKITDSRSPGGNISINENNNSITLEKKQQTQKTIERIYQSSSNYLERPNVRPWPIWLLIILAIFSGLISALVINLVILTQEKIFIPFLGEFSLKKYFPTKEVVLTTEKKITVTNDLRIADIIKELSPQIINISVLKTTPKTADLSLEQFYLPENSLGNGFSLTNNGWAIVAQKVLSEFQKKYLLTADRQSSLAEKIITDPVNDVVFIKTSLDNLSPSKIAAPEEITVGQQILILSPDKSLSINYLSNLSAHETTATQNYIHSTDKFEEFFLLQNPVENKFIGSPVISLDKSIVGFVIDKKLVKPCFHLKNIIPMVLGGKKITHPYLGLHYIDLNEAQPTENARIKNYNYGALVWKDPLKNSPADKAGLMANDLIIKADGLPLNNYNLTRIIQDHQANDVLELVVVHQNVEKTIKVTLE